MSAGDDRIIVIGSGPSGAMAAKELTDAGMSVTMLEVGLRPPGGIIVRAAGHTVFRWRSQSQLLADRHVALGDPATEWFSALSPGGLSNYWTAAVPRFAPRDFTDGARLDERFEWPIRYEDLVQHYAAAEDLLSISGQTTSSSVLPAGRVKYATSMSPAWRALGAAMEDHLLTLLPMARGPRWMIARRGSEFNSYHVVVSPLEKAASFELRVGARVTKMLLSSNSGAVNGVEYIDVNTNVRATLRGRAVVLAAGTIDSTRILLNSVSPQHPAGLGNGSGLVGRYLHDHPREWWVAEFANPMPLVDDPVYLARESFDVSAPLSGSSATIGFESMRQRLMAMARMTGRRFGVQVFGTMVPDGSLAVSLPRDRSDDSATERVELRIRYDDAALATLSDARKRFQRVFAAAGNAVTIHPVDWLPRPGSSVHYAGSVRMHRRPEFGVLDEWNRVYEAPNVLVVDMSCFTTNPEKNPTLTAMAIAARAARRLASNPPM